MKDIGFNCNKCGRCCYNWKINLNIMDIKKIKGLGFKVIDFAEIKDSSPVLKFYNDKCLFLDKDNLCLIQKKFGFDNKPQVCKEFPYNDLICGTPEFKNIKKLQKYSLNKDYFFRIGNKLIDSLSFTRLLGKIDLNQPIFDSYCNLLLNLMKEEEKIIISPIKIKNLNPIVKRNLKKELESSILRISVNPLKRIFPSGNIVLKFPLERASFYKKNADIPKELKKEFIFYLQKNTVHKIYLKDYPIFVLLYLYAIPRLLNPNKKTTILDIMHKLSLLNSLTRFNSDKFKLFYYKALKINLNLPETIYQP